jgi:hypothetical protein
MDGLTKVMNEDRAIPERVPDPEPKRNQVGALVPGRSGKEKMRPRVTVRVVRCSTRTLDPDNLRGSVKALLDCLRGALLISDDTESAISLDVSQVHVNTRKEHGTKIELIYEDGPA